VGCCRRRDSIPELLLEGMHFNLLPQLVCVAANSFVPELQYRFISLQRRRSGCRDSILYPVSSPAHVCVCVCVYVRSSKWQWMDPLELAVAEEVDLSELEL